MESPVLFIFESQAPSAAHSLIWSLSCECLSDDLLLFTPSKILATQEFSQVHTFAVLPIIESIGVAKIHSLLHHKCCMILHECLCLSIFHLEKSLGRLQNQTEAIWMRKSSLSI